MNTNHNKKQGESQSVMILEFLLTGCRLTVLDALKYFGCLSLSQRISGLNAEGWGIRKRMITTSTNKRVAEYYL